MSKYKIIDDLPLPYSEFHNLDKKTLKLYAKWFFDNKEKRIGIMTSAVKEERDFSMWRPDYSPESTKVLAKWLNMNIERVPIPQEEIEEAKRRALIPSVIEEWRFSNKTRSKIVDIGIYFGEIMIRNHEDKNLKWEQCLLSRKYFDYGQMIINVGPTWMEPIQLIDVQASIMNDGDFSEDCLMELYNIWCKYLQ
jgi:hypothetical protein